jgi:hypothetical protein
MEKMEPNIQVVVDTSFIPIVVGIYGKYIFYKLLKREPRSYPRSTYEIHAEDIWRNAHRLPKSTCPRKVEW